MSLALMETLKREGNEEKSSKYEEKKDNEGEVRATHLSLGVLPERRKLDLLDSNTSSLLSSRRLCRANVANADVADMEEDEDEDEDGEQNPLMIVVQL